MRRKVSGFPDTSVNTTIRGAITVPLKILPDYTTLPE